MYDMLSVLRIAQPSTTKLTLLCLVLLYNTLHKQLLLLYHKQQLLNSNPDLPTLIYYTRKEAGTPRVSPKAGNMNAAIFAMDYPEEEALIGDSTIIAVNDCRYVCLCVRLCVL
jgi:hypothetical protein